MLRYEKAHKLMWLVLCLIEIIGCATGTNSRKPTSVITKSMLLKNLPLGSSREKVEKFLVSNRYNYSKYLYKSDIYILEFSNYDKHDYNIEYYIKTSIDIKKNDLFNSWQINIFFLFDHNNSLCGILTDEIGHGL